jgi:hypothetical protein
MTKKFPIHPQHPERVCWGCDRYCAADALMCGNGTVATMHPAELFGEDWLEWGLDAAANVHEAVPSAPTGDAGRDLELAGDVSRLLHF